MNSKAYNEGYAAYCDYQSKNNDHKNPYRPGTNESQEWLNGWNAADMDTFPQDLITRI